MENIEEIVEERQENEKDKNPTIKGIFRVVASLPQSASQFKIEASMQFNLDIHRGACRGLNHTRGAKSLRAKIFSFMLGR